MYKAVVLLIFGLLLGTMVGCGQSERDVLIAETLKYMGGVTDMFSGLQKDLTNTMDIRKKEKAQINDEDWKKLIAKAEGFKEIAEKTQKLKQKYIDPLPALSEEQKDQFAQNYGKDFRTRAEDLDKEVRALEKTLNEAEAMTAPKDLEYVKTFRKHLKDGTDVFELLTKQH